MIAGQRFLNPFSLHDHKRNAVGQRPLLVQSLLVETHPARVRQHLLTQSFPPGAFRRGLKRPSAHFSPIFQASLPPQENHALFHVPSISHAGIIPRHLPRALTTPPGSTPPPPRASSPAG